MDTNDKTLDEAKARQDQNVTEFLEAVVNLGKQYGLSLAHEDHHGAFIVLPYDEDEAHHLRMAFDKTESRPK